MLFESRKDTKVSFALIDQKNIDVYRTIRNTIVPIISIHARKSICSFYGYGLNFAIRKIGTFLSTGNRERFQTAEAR